MSLVGAGIRRLDRSIRESQIRRDVLLWGFLVLALIVWCAAQTSLVAWPLWTRVLPMEVDDVLPYLVRVEELDECPRQDCPALNDLRGQLFAPSSDDEVARERGYATSPFPHYHPFFSVILLGLKKAGFDLVIAYKIVWTIGPLFMGIGLAYFLVSLFGKPAAGWALILMAAKVFPAGGLHLVVPSFFATGMALLLWGRIISRKGDCPWSMPLGSAAIVAMHPVGLVYVALGILMALSFGGLHRTSKAWRSVFITAVLFVGAFAVSVAFGVRHIVVPLQIIPTDGHAFVTLLRRGMESFGAAVLPELLRLEGGLFGSVAFFCGWVALGLFSLDNATRRPLLPTLGFYFMVLAISLFHFQFSPGELFFRLWIPFLVMLYGIVAAGFSYLVGESWDLLLTSVKAPGTGRTISMEKAWPAILLAVFFGYGFMMSVRGGEQIVATALYLKDREPFAFYKEQPERLMAEAKPGDRVLYTSQIIMPYYFIYGAMQLGAVYYRPALERTQETMEWLRRNDIRFAATYNPTLYRPRGEGLGERRCLNSPQFYFSPLSDPPVYSPLSKEGALHSEDYRWLDLTPTSGDFPKKVRIFVRNDGAATSLGAGAWGRGDSAAGPWVTHPVPLKWEGWIEYDVIAAAGARSIRIGMPPRPAQLAISGIALDDEKHFWPWTSKTVLKLMSTNPFIGESSVSFDPARCLPSLLRDRKITVLNDRGSSVLFKVE